MPRAYASRRRSGERSPPAASSPFGSISAWSTGGNGSQESSHGMEAISAKCEVEVPIYHQMLTRYAPSPTGHLHLGHVVNAIYVWGLARAAGGRVLLRMEDHDRVRCRREFESSILEDLDWLGFVPDDGLHPILRQSERDDVYRSALEQLRRTHHVYACACSRKQISG